MALFDPVNAPVSIVTVQQSRFGALRERSAFRSALAAEFGQSQEPVFAMNMGALASRNGFGGGIGNPRRTITLCAWRDESSARRYLDSQLGRAGTSDWSVLLEVLSTRGAHHHAVPLVGSGAELGDGPLAALTLGTTRWRSLVRFMVRGSRMRKDLAQSPGLLFATSAGWPTTGNSTFSLWENERAMQQFAYGVHGAHVKTAHAKRPVLSGQLNARMRVIDTRGELQLKL